MHYTPIRWFLKPILFAFAITLPYAASAQKMAAKGMVSKELNYSYFSTVGNPEKDLPYDAPCDDCVEDLSARTAYSRSYTGKNGLVYSQSGHSPINIKNKLGHWVPVDARLRPVSANMYAARDQYFPTEIDLSRGSKITNPYGEIRFNNKPELLWRGDDGNVQSMGKANFSTYTAGDDGVRITDVWPGIDMEMRVLLGGIKTNFVVKQRPQQTSGSFIIRDEMELSNGLHIALTDDGITINSSNGEEAYHISSCIGYDSHPSRANGSQDFAYALQANTLDMVIPISVLQDPKMVYPYTIDPLVNSSNTLPQASITGSAYSAACFVNYCSYNLTVPSPANATITDVLWSFNYVAAGSCWLYDGAVTYTSGACASPNQAGYYWFCNGIGTGTCTGSNISMFSDVSSCMPAPSCTPQNIPFTMRFYRCYSNSAGCSNACIGAASPWTITIVGQTVAVASATVNGSGSTTICEGSSATLAANGTYGVAPYTYTWNPGNINGTPVTVSPTTNTTYTLTVTDACSQTSTANVTVNVTPRPATPSVSSNSPVCAGATINLSTGSAGNYYWTGPNGFTSTVQNPSIPSATAANGGTYSLYIIQSGCSSLAGTHTVVVNPTPSAPTAGGNSPICAGSTLNLTGSGGSSYYWTGPNAFTSTSQNPSIAGATAANAGTYTLYAIAAGCTSSASTYSVTVNPIPATPTPGSNSPVCVGSTINLTGPASSGTYVWSGPNAFASSTQNPSISNATAANGGTYSLYVVENGCTSGTGTVSVTVINPPITPSFTTNSPVCQGSTITLNGSFYPFVNYIWSGPNGFSATGQNASVPNATLANAGNYSLALSASGCTSTATVQAVVVNPSPAAPTASGNSPVCAGATITLTSTGAGAGTYYWTGPNSFTSNTQNPSIPSASAANAGAYQSYYIENGCTSSAAVYNIVVNAIPATPSPSSNSPVCVGSTLNLSTNTATSGSYVWTGPNSFNSSLQNPSISNVTSANGGTYNLSVVENGCSSSVASISVNVISPPVTPSFTTNSPVCEGGTITLTGATYPIVSYQWSGPNGYTASGQTVSIPNATTANSGNYSLTIAASGCTSTATVQSVVVNPTPPAPTLSGNSPVCAGSSINLNASATGGTYYWTGPNSFSSTLQNPSISPATAANTGTYSAYYIENGCTSSAATYAVVVNALPATPVASSNSPVCVGNAITFTTPTVTGGSYSWSGPNAFSSASQNPSIATASLNDAGTYSVTVTQNGCTSAAGTVTVSVTALPATPTITSNSPICEGGTLQLNTSVGATTYVWSGPNGFTSSLQNPTLSPISAANAGNYNLYIVASGCTSATGNAIVQIANSPTVSYTGISNFCGNQVSLSASASISAPSTITGYEWLAPNPIGTGSNLNYAFTQTPPATVNGSVIATSNNGCKDTVTFTLQLHDTPIADFAAEELCDGESAQFTEQHSWQGNETDNPNFTWIYNGSSFSNAANPSENFGGPGTYNVTLVVSNTAYTACSDTISKPITIHTLPTIDFTYLAECIKDVQFSGSATPDSLVTTYTWDYGDGDNGNGVNSTHAYAQSATYNVVFTVITASGCTTAVTKPVQIDNAGASAPEIPNIFTPNGDNVNDYIDMDELTNECGDYEFTVFSRWGNVVFTQRNGGAPFEGKNTMGGGWLVPGVYYYVLSFNGEKTSGSITVIR